GRCWRSNHQAACGPSEYQNESDQIEDLGNSVGEQEDGPIQVIGHVHELGKGVEAKPPTQECCRTVECAIGKECCDQETDQVHRQEEGGRESIDKSTVRHGNLRIGWAAAGVLQW